MTDATKSRTSNRAAKVVAALCLGLLTLLLVVFAGVNLFVSATYAPFYANASRAFPIPGTNEGFIVQDLDELEDGTWLFSGYAASGPSPLYALHPDGSTAQFTVLRPDGSTYDGHGSGITSDGTHAFLTDDEGFLAFNVTDLQNAAQGDAVAAIGRRSLEFAPAFMNIEEGSLYLGDFYHPGAYETPEQHHLDTPSGSQNPAVMYAYPQDENGAFGYADQANCVYSIPERIQGMCITGDGQMVLSQSYGLASSHLLVYDLSSMIAPSTTEEPYAEGAAFTADARQVPLFYLDDLTLVKDVTAPPMSEGIEWHDGQVYLSSESASDKYLFGKLYGAGYVYALSI